MKTVKIDITSQRTGGQLCTLNCWHVSPSNDIDTFVAGLKGVQELPDGIDGMVFDFERNAQQVMTMRGCEMPLAFMFVNENMQIRQLEERVEPDPDSPPIVSSGMDVRYVVELCTTAALGTRASLNDIIAIRS